MILLQILLIPGLLFFAMGAVILVACTGIDNPKRQNRIDQEITWFNGPDTLWSVNSINLPPQYLRRQKTGNEWIELFQAEVINSNSYIEALPLVSIEKFSEEK